MNISKLTETVTMLEDNQKHNKLSFNKFKEVLKTRACITALHSEDKIYEIIIPKINLNKMFTAVMWNNKIYKINQPLKPFKEKFLKGIIKLF